jgi:hypothetical protein
LPARGHETEIGPFEFVFPETSVAVPRFQVNAEPAGGAILQVKASNAFWQMESAELIAAIGFG